jgi:cell division protein FtsW
VLLAAMGLLLNVAGGGSTQLRAVPEPKRREPADRDRGRRDRGTRRAGDSGRRRAAS